MKRFPAFFSVLVLSASATFAGVLGTEYPEIRLADGKVLTAVKILGCSENNAVIIAQKNNLRTVPLNKFPEPLRQQISEEGAARRELNLRTNRSNDTYRRDPRTVPPPTDNAPEVTPSTPATTPTGTGMEALVEEAAKEAPDELRFYLLKTTTRVSGFTTKIRRAEQVQGWQKIRVSGDAAYSYWEEAHRDYVWRSDKFEVEFAIVDGRRLQLSSVTFGGISRSADPGVTSR
jgi:hypothetical protein